MQKLPDDVRVAIAGTPADPDGHTFPAREVAAVAVGGLASAVGRQTLSRAPRASSYPGPVQAAVADKRTIKGSADRRRGARLHPGTSTRPARRLAASASSSCGLTRDDDRCFRRQRFKVRPRRRSGAVVTSADRSAALDPWMVQTAEEGRVLFGYCPKHYRLGGRSWIVTSGIVHLDEAASVARTRSGTLYLLGRRIKAADLPDEEARAAFEALIVRRGPVPASARAWLASCKMARWLALRPPAKSDPVAVDAFLARHMPAYINRRTEAVRCEANPDPGDAGEHPPAARTLAPATGVEDATLQRQAAAADAAMEAGAADAAMEAGAILRAEHGGRPVVIARAGPAELAALIGARPGEAFRDQFSDWTLVAIRGLRQGTRVHALGWRIGLEDVWITSAIASISHGPISVTTASGHSYGLRSQRASALGPRLRRHLDFALASWGFEGTRPQ